MLLILLITYIYVTLLPEIIHERDRSHIWVQNLTKKDPDNLFPPGFSGVAKPPPFQPPFLEWGDGKLEENHPEW